MLFALNINKYLWIYMMQNSTEQLIIHLKALADPIRLRLLALCVRGEATVSELTEVMGQSQPRISQHLKQLCGAGLLERFRDGHFVYYRVPLGSKQATQRRRLFALLPSDEPAFDQDFDKLCQSRARQGIAVPEQDDEAVRRVFERLLPQATQIVALHFQRTVVARALARLRGRGDSAALEMALEATQSARLEVQWR